MGAFMDAPASAQPLASAGKIRRRWAPPLSHLVFQAQLSLRASLVAVFVYRKIVLKTFSLRFW